MKKTISLLMTLAMVAVLSISLSGCDDDDYIAGSLEGTWSGNLNVEYEYGDVWYQSVYSELCFSQDPYTYSSGSGYWIDYYQNYGWGRNYIANHINWTVRSGVIYIHFYEEGTDIEIHDYYLDDNYFEGYIYLDGSRTSFKLVHTSSPNWGGIDFGYDFYDYGYAKPNGKAMPQSKPRRRIISPSKD